MDLGVGSFSQSVFSAAPLLKDPEHLSRRTLPKVFAVARKIPPGLGQGLVRGILVKGADYPEHVTEYGVHWNFFITLALPPVLQVLQVPLIVSMLLLAVLCALELRPLRPADNPRVGEQGRHRLALLYVLTVSLLSLHDPSPKYFHRQQQALAHRRKDNNIVTTASSTVTGPGKVRMVNGRREDDRTATELISYPMVWCTRGSVRGGVLRRLICLSFHSLSTPLPDI
ncbi:hypothetical protein GLOTRDRAFT_133917 [Gloeophyllum trabeum ATCC 11539]|uniref:GPI-anchored wall transfer protein 1 n=1 Tax=Gloeophyllum trabeum (strain ATCC 11539 / FP-39264 / Madison 617) TaxID=670483 RepID=S7PRW9_GLOTA|nr:uncharacterized protein GLOTRDRAFT_133917 [Gloeophyllum trabeum ATCC 11539]EPQ50551.1 hypothetical protein GLOTRDRAFT_133917 [Gloeophyllum trabeum ATCC 11539]